MSKENVKKAVLTDGALQHRFLGTTDFKSLNDYYNSEKWKNFRKEILSERKKECELCEKSKQVELHHKHYRNLGECSQGEKESIVILCRTCHNKIHKSVKNISLRSFWQDVSEREDQQTIEICTNFFLENEKVPTNPKNFRNDEQSKKQWVRYSINKSSQYKKGRLTSCGLLRMIGESNLLPLCQNRCACCENELDYYVRLDQIYFEIQNTNLPPNKQIPMFSKIDIFRQYEEGNVQVVCKDCFDVKNGIKAKDTKKKLSKPKSKNEIIIRRKRIE